MAKRCVCFLFAPCCTFFLHRINGASLAAQLLALFFCEEELQSENEKLKEKLREKVWTMALATVAWRHRRADMAGREFEPMIFDGFLGELMDRVAC